MYFKVLGLKLQFIQNARRVKVVKLTTSSIVEQYSLHRYLLFGGGLCEGSMKRKGLAFAKASYRED